MNQDARTPSAVQDPTNYLRSAREAERDSFLIGGDRPEFTLCRPRVLMVTDRFLEFSTHRAFGLGTFVSVILDMHRPADPRVTLGHLGGRGASFLSDDRLSRTITQFRFDDPNHFGTEMYDVVFIFGFGDRGRNLDPDDPSESLDDTELDAIARYMNAGGGLFATGDHGRLGRYLGHRLPRAGRMRLWQGLTGVSDDEKAMTGPNRHDTNAPDLGGASTTFDHQSDDRPQMIYPQFYHRYSALWRYSFPHPLLCSSLGVIRVMPDHPHEGECVTPDDVDARIDFGQDLGPEFPPSISGGLRPLPETIAISLVPGGNRAVGGMNGQGQDKEPTRPHSFGGICAYDGHRARVGRVVTDATWHHFVNVNLTGAGTQGNGGFLGSQEGLAHFEMIQHYYRNLVLWLCPPDVIRCILHGWVFELVTSSAVIEAITDGARRSVGETDVATLSYIGGHARDVLGERAGACESRRLQAWVVDHLAEAPDHGVLFRNSDPWAPRADHEDERSDPLDIDLPLLNVQVLQDVTLGAALIEARDMMDRERGEMDGERLEEAIARGARLGLKRAREAARTILETVLERL